MFQVRKKDTGRIYAMKVLPKKTTDAEKGHAQHLNERAVLHSLDSPFLVRLRFSFQTGAHFYLVTDFMSGGELFWHLQRDIRFPEARARFYVAELVLALAHLHERGIMYRCARRPSPTMTTCSRPPARPAT